MKKFHLIAKRYSSTSKLRIYNSLSKTKEELRLNNKKTLYWYVCGPTVYDVSHIGHAW
jgi:cysteinyl-tRNA synthetase